MNDARERRGEDLTGRVISYLTVLRPVYVARRKQYLWECKCVCGKVVRKQGSRLKTPGVVTSCGCKKRRPDKALDLTGQTFGKLTVLHPAGNNRWGARRWVCQCACGREHTAVGAKMRRGEVASCGCNNPAHNGPKHGMYNTPTYHTWCNVRYMHKGDHDPRWVDFREFLADMGARMEAERLVRLDKTKPYSMENCEWRPLQKQK